MSGTATDAEVTPETIVLEGSWRLVACELWRDGTCIEPCFSGRNPVAFIHYLPGQRMVFLCADGGRPRTASNDRSKVTDAEYIAAAKSFHAYAGPYDRDGAMLVHHLEVSFFENDTGTDYIRRIGIEGRYLTLSSLPMPHPAGPVTLKLTWDRVVAPSPKSHI